MVYNNIGKKRASSSKDYPATQNEKKIYRAIKKIVNKGSWINVHEAFGKDNYYISIWDGSTYFKKYLPNGNISTQIIFSNYLRKLKGYEVEIENMNSGVFKITKKEWYKNV